MSASRLTTLFVLTNALLGTAIAAPSPGCAANNTLPKGQTPGGDSVTVAFTQSDGTARDYRIHIPSTYVSTTPAELIFSFHGHGTGASGQETISQLSNEAFNPSGIAVYPQGKSDAWQGAPYAVTGINDIEFVKDMISNFTETYCIDTSKIYASGMSIGGGFTATLACDSSVNTQIAAFAPVSGAYYINTTTCAPTAVEIPCDKGDRIVPVIEFHGDADTTIPYGGESKNGDCLPEVSHWVRSWSYRDGLGLKNITTYDLYSGKVTRSKFPNNSSDPNFGLVQHYKTAGLGHIWPSTNSTSYDATPIIMEFFGNHTL
ncbi:Bifunctional acetylxylan esterase/xylanase [Lachnellula hyalina]|uniref:feruloyl esterase n=1 Tax=Lachnellula hyalina TaxID=1316788 RepID=A0A8H8R9A8_9HELO|nr:Bifunctional acetylxylan esterase/xylanase [Lachnellula hyalina]TVY30348.1 Bifunctional acetylxylan esterase/xylanase [Lachnellula hyalina]